MVNVNDSPVKAVVTAVPDDLTIRALRPYFMVSTEITDDFRIANLPAGLYTIHYTKLGYVSQSKKRFWSHLLALQGHRRLLCLDRASTNSDCLTHTSDKP